MIIINGESLETQSVLGARLAVCGKVRPAVSIRVAGGDYETLARLFSGDTDFILREETQQGVLDHDYSAYTVAGDITDHRDGSFTVVMARRTEEEEEIEALRRQLGEERSEISRLRERLAIPAWTELASGTEIDLGAQVRYLGSEFSCVKEHAKLLTRAPGNREFWTPEENV